MTAQTHDHTVYDDEPQPMPRWRTVVPVTVAIALLAAMVLTAAMGIDALVGVGQGLFGR